MTDRLEIYVNIVLSILSFLSVGKTLSDLLYPKPLQGLMTYRDRFAVYFHGILLFYSSSALVSMVFMIDIILLKDVHWIIEWVASYANRFAMAGFFISILLYAAPRLLHKAIWKISDEMTMVIELINIYVVIIFPVIAAISFGVEDFLYQLFFSAGIGLLTAVVVHVVFLRKNVDQVSSSFLYIERELGDREYIYYNLDNDRYLCGNTPLIKSAREYHVLTVDELMCGKTLHTVMEEPLHSSGRNLFIIGNGFDLAHNLPTQYSCFRNYLLSLSIQSEEKHDNMVIPGQMGPQIWHTEGDEIVPSPSTEFYADVVRWLVDDAAGKRHRMDWCDFESYLGKLSFEEVLRHWIHDGGDDSAYNSLREAVDSIRGFVSDWINTIELCPARPREKYKDIIDGERDYAITFNYTETLEMLYGMKQDHVCHIHGKRETAPELIERKKNLPIGDNNCELIVGTKEMKKTESKDRYTALRGSLVKDTANCITDHKEFFGLIRDYQVNDIYSIGFSFSEVDNPYIKKIISVYESFRGTEDMTWHLSDYDNLIKRMKYKKIIKKAGFRGKIVKG